MTNHTPFFDYGFSVGTLVNIGKKRSSNQDEVIACHESGFYAVSDGMGGLPKGGQTSAYIKKVLPERIEGALEQLSECPSADYAADLLTKQIVEINETVYKSENLGNWSEKAGATLSGVWLTGNHAIFVNLGDSRGYILPQHRKKIRQITNDHNMAALLVRTGNITKEEARFHWTSSMLTGFIGKTPPVLPDYYIREVHPGDQILLCSDGLSGMVSDTVLPSIMRSSANPDCVCERLVETANENGGRDNISVVYIQIVKGGKRKNPSKKAG